MTPQRQLSVAVATLVVIALAPGLTSAGPLILNGDFSLGYNGFASNYVYRSSDTLPNYRLMYPEGTFTVGTDPSQVHGLWASFGDHTTGDGGMMIVNGNRAADVLVWSSTVEVAADTNYDFSAWVASVYPASPASLAFSINGILLDAPFGASSTTGLWRQFANGWYSGTNRTAVLSIVNQNIEWWGNDFALDDIMLNAIAPIEPLSFDASDFTEEPAAVPEPGSSLLLFGSGLAAFAGIPKNRKN